MVVLLEACDITNNGHHLGRHLRKYQEVEIRLKPREMLLLVLYMKNNTKISTLHDFSLKVYFYC